MWFTLSEKPTKETHNRAPQIGSGFVLDAELNGKKSV